MMTRIKIKDLPEDAKVSKEEMTKIAGGGWALDMQPPFFGTHRSRIRSPAVAERNTNNARGMAQNAEGGLVEIWNPYGPIRGLALALKKDDE